jgi:23S rRNA (adenine2503-C2)-methyltransferase
MYKLVHFIICKFAFPMPAPKDIRQFSLKKLKFLFSEMGEQAFRAQQVYDWLWKKSARSFDEMTSLSKELREMLKKHFLIHAVTIASYQKSMDGTIKNAFRLHEGYMVEGVLIPTGTRLTACISTQVGCSLTCSFCATGRLDRLRNLRADEIYDQVALMRRQAEEEYGSALTHIVYMGMGEPLLNYKNVMESVEKITSPQGLKISPQRITVSTAGIAKMIKQLGDDGAKFNFALSLHAANDFKRSKIMPINEHNSLESLADALKYFYRKTGTRVTYEYIVFRDFNDTPGDAEELAGFCRSVVPCKVNVIEYNPVDHCELRQTTSSKLNHFISHLEKRKIIVNIRRSRGRDIDAACGQLANKNKYPEIKLKTTLA